MRTRTVRGGLSLAGMWVVMVWGIGMGVGILVPTPASRTAPTSVLMPVLTSASTLVPASAPQNRARLPRSFAEQAG